MATRKAALSADLKLGEFLSTSNSSSIEKIASNCNLELCHAIDESESISLACLDSYRKTHPLLYALAAGQETRTAALQADGAAQIFYPKSNEGWYKTLFIWEGRSLDYIAGVWLVIVFHAILYTCFIKLLPATFGFKTARDEVESWSIFFGIVLQSALGMLLVFRLNRAASRWWSARKKWGFMMARARTFTSGLLVHAGHSPRDRENVLRWMAAYAVAVSQFLHETSELDGEMFAGILSPSEVLLLQENCHPPLFAAEQMRYFLKKIFNVTADTPLALSVAWTQQLMHLEALLDDLMNLCGGMERIKATPLPIVYVSHLRTFLVGSLLLCPYIYGHQWGWSTIPLTGATSFALLGIEAASAEVEQPFHQNRPNSLNMDGYCIGILANLLQVIRQHADREIEQQQQEQQQQEQQQQSNTNFVEKKLYNCVVQGGR